MPDGGLRDRLIIESLYRGVEGHLTTLGWFDPGREHASVVMKDGFPDDDDEVAPNTLAMSVGPTASPDAELGGSKLVEHEMTLFFDFFAESDAMARHLMGDVFQYVRSNDSHAVYDYSDAGQEIFKVEIVDDADLRPVSRAVNQWQKHWMVVSFTVIDSRTLP